jgi:hypothetical protein
MPDEQYNNFVTGEANSRHYPQERGARFAEGGEQHGCGFGWLFGGLCLERALEFFMRTLN